MTVTPCGLGLSYRSDREKLCEGQITKEVANTAGTYSAPKITSEVCPAATPTRPTKTAITAKPSGMDQRPPKRSNQRPAMGPSTTVNKMPGARVNEALSGAVPRAACRNKG